MQGQTYRGRFAPTPNGPLHFGSLVTALASYLDARAHTGEWLVRIEDLDPPRAMAGAADDILRTLEAFGLQWDAEVFYQSRRHATYQARLEQLERKQLVYPCACTRKEIQEQTLGTVTGPVYPGTCRNGLPEGREARSLRVRVGERDVRFRDRLQGEVEESLPRQVGDFVLRRADGLFAYQLATVVDDAEQGITDIVRGADLLGSTGRQIFLQQALGFATPAYLHLPVATNAAGEKLSKQTRAAAIQPQRAADQLAAALRFLGQPLPREAQTGTVEEILVAATRTWQPDRIPHVRQIPV